MTIKINDNILSIPPHISTSWSRVASLHVKGNLLAITLTDGDTIHIPNLDSQTIQLIFHYHALYLEKEHPQEASTSEGKLKGIVEEPSIRVAFGTSLEGLGMMMQHNPAQADSPDLPPEILQKIEAISKIIAPSSEELLMPKAEPGCNCFHCQIARVINSGVSSLEQSPEEQEEVLDKELQFQQWAITQIGDKLFLVVNRLDDHEQYHVYLGQPIGCTCGKQGCEHILAVLKS